MLIRFDSNLTYQYFVSDDVGDITIPKLLIQPLVENAFKHGFQGEPPWNLSVKAYKENENWLISVTNTSGSLSDETRKKLLDDFDALLPFAKLPPLKIGGMGLKTVALRLRLLYGEKAVFKIDNSTPDQTVFSVGGPLDWDWEQEGYFNIQDTIKD